MPPKSESAKHQPKKEPFKSREGLGMFLLQLAELAFQVRLLLPSHTSPQVASQRQQSACQALPTRLCHSLPAPPELALQPSISLPMRPPFLPSLPLQLGEVLVAEGVPFDPLLLESLPGSENTGGGTSMRTAASAKELAIGSCQAVSSACCHCALRARASFFLTLG